MKIAIQEVICGKNLRLILFSCLLLCSLASAADGRGAKGRGGGGGDDSDPGVRVWDGQIKWDDDVVILNGRNMHSFVRKHSHVLVQVFAPWCGHCKKFEPVYRKAASHLRLWGSDAILAKVDGPANPNLSREMGVAGFPSLHWFAYGEERAYEGGRRNDSLVEWVSHHSRADAVTVVSSPREAEDFLSRIGAEECVIGRFSSKHAREAKAFFLAAEEDTVGRPEKMMVYVMITEGRGIGLGKIGSVPNEAKPEGEVYGPPIGPSVLIRRSKAAGGGTVVLGRWYQPPLWHTNTPNVRFSLLHADRIKAFVGTYWMPSVVTLSPSTWDKVLSSPNRNQTILFSDSGTPGHMARMAAFEEVATAMFGRVLFLHIPSNMTNIMAYFGMTAEDFPALVVAVAPGGEDDSGKGQMHRLEQTSEGRNLTKLSVAAEQCTASREEGAACKEEGGLSPLSSVIRAFAFSSFEGREEEFVLPKQDLSDDVHYPDDPVAKLTPSDFAKVALDPERDVLVKFYAPWCGHCKAMKVGYMELSDKMELHAGVTIAEFDASAHTVPERVKHMVQGYPTLILFPSGRGGPEPVVYEGGRDRDAMAAWIEGAAPTIVSNKALRDKIKVLEEEQKTAVEEERFEDAAKIRDELAALRKQAAGSEVLAPGAGTPKHRMPVFGDRILKEALNELKAKGGGREESKSVEGGGRDEL